MYKSYWSMEFNPFIKDDTDKIKETYFNSNDFKNATARLEHLKNIKGIGLFTGFSGTGKTFALRYFSKNLNPSLYKVIYIQLSTITVLEFYKSLSYGLDLEPPNKKVDMFRDIQQRIVSLSKDKKITPVVIIDESQYLKTDLLNDLKLLMNFDMDSKNYVVLILLGQPVLNNILSKQIHEALKQRIVISYNFEGISKNEVKEYITSRLELCGVHSEIFSNNAIEAIFGCCNGSTRKLNNIVDKCLVIGYMNKATIIDTDIVMSAQNEIELT
ncbi:UNVERIFIED_CONTAM: type II secretory pathway predicted ATPase ExeA [Acetivibrio alkalicellulosi]